MQNTPSVTIICSCYNHEKFVIESLQSVVNQSYSNIQLMVIDDYSSDDSVAVIDEFVTLHPDIIFIKNSSNLGITQSVMNAMKWAKGDYFMDLAADDVLLPECIANLVQKVQNSIFDNLAIVYANCELISETGQHLFYYFETNENHKTLKIRPIGDIYIDVISPETVICSVTALYNMTIFKNLNGYDNRLAYEDLDYWIRASRQYNIDYLDEILVQKRIIPTSLHAQFSKRNNVIAYSTHLILKKAFFLNRTKAEHRVLIDRVVLEIKNNVKQLKLFLLLKNIWLSCLICFKSVF